MGVLPLKLSALTWYWVKIGWKHLVQCGFTGLTNLYMMWEFFLLSTLKWWSLLIWEEELLGLKHVNKLCPLISDNKLKSFLNRQAVTQLCSAMFWFWPVMYHRPPFSQLAFQPRCKSWYLSLKIYFRHQLLYHLLDPLITTLSWYLELSLST